MKKKHRKTITKDGSTGNAVAGAVKPKHLTKWFLGTVLALLLCCILVAAIQIIVDPYFHYHKPLKQLFYKIEEERYQNDGIIKHFDYNALIAGSSMTENFKTSEMDELFGVTSVKTPFAGGSYKEVGDLVKKAAAYNDDLSIVIRGIDYNRFFNDKDELEYDDYPTYLYDDNPFNDISYLLNVNVLLMSLQNIIEARTKGAGHTSFDVYANWNYKCNFGKEYVKYSYLRSTVQAVSEQTQITEEQYETISENIQQNLIDVATANPEIEFYYFYTPYSICYFDYIRLTGELDSQLLAEKYITEMLLPYDNIHIYSFFDKTDLITNLDNYRDTAHYGEDINSDILRWIRDGEGELTSDNYEEYFASEWEYFHNFDYETYFADWGM